MDGILISIPSQLLFNLTKTDSGFNMFGHYSSPIFGCVDYAKKLKRKMLILYFKKKKKIVLILKLQTIKMKLINQKQSKRMKLLTREKKIKMIVILDTLLDGMKKKIIVNISWSVKSVESLIEIRNYIKLHVIMSVTKGA